MIRWTYVAPAIAALALAGCSAEDTGGEGDSGGGGNGESSSKAECGSRATEDCTPTVGASKSVRVDALVWRVSSARTAKQLGNAEFGLAEKANGTFVVVKLKVTSRKNESATLTDNSVKLVAPNGNTYDPDLDGTTALVTGPDGDGEPFFLEDIGPDSSAQGTVVFDVPASVASKRLKVRFNELGFGETHGLIRLPKLSA
jgi:Domain of unknown function (DUF4352)